MNSLPNCRVLGDSAPLTVEEACPQEPKLEVAVRPDTLRPVLPLDTPVPAYILERLTEATAMARVTTCPAQGGSPPASVEVTFRVEPPPPASADDGGHVHGARPEAAFGRLEPSLPGRPKEASCLVTTFNAEGRGACDVPLTYHSSEVSGKETIEAKAAGFPSAEAKVTVQVPGLVNLADVQTNFWRLTGQTGPDNHWGTSNTATNVQLVALDFFEEFRATLGINDMSLRFGGMFDIHAIVRTAPARAWTLTRRRAWPQPSGRL